MLVLQSHWGESRAHTSKYGNLYFLFPSPDSSNVVSQKRTDILPTRSSANVKSSAAASTSKSKLPGLSRAVSTTTDTKPIVKSEPKDVKLGVKEEPLKPKPSGKLDFSKAKPAAPKIVPEVRKAEPAEPSSVSDVAPKQEPKTSKPKHKVCFPHICNLVSG